MIKCKHKFHETCLYDQWITAVNTVTESGVTSMGYFCPTCRRPCELGHLTQLVEGVRYFRKEYYEKTSNMTISTDIYDTLKI